MAQHKPPRQYQNPWLMIADLCPLCPALPARKKDTHRITFHILFFGMLLSDIVVSCHIVTNIQIAKVLDVACPKFETLRIMRYNKCLGHQEKRDLHSL